MRAFRVAGKLDEAHTSIARVLKSKPGWFLQKEAVWPTMKQAAVYRIATPLVRPGFSREISQSGLCLAPNAMYFAALV
jgi:hypothetical protein